MSKINKNIVHINLCQERIKEYDIIITNIQKRIIGRNEIITHLLTIIYSLYKTLKITITGTRFDCVPSIDYNKDLLKDMLNLFEEHKESEITKLNKYLN